MSYIGRGIDQIDNISTLDNLSFNGSDATFNLTQNSVAFVPVSADALQIQIDGVIQSGNYTVSGSQVTFDFTPSGSSVCNGIKHFGVGLLTTVSDGAVTNVKLGADSVNGSKIADDSISDEHLDNTAITGQTAITSLADTDKFLVSDASDSGNLKYVEKQYLPSGSFAKLSTVDISSGDSSVNFNSSIITTTYKQYFFEFTDVRPTGDNTYFKMQESTNNGSSFLQNDCDWQFTFQYSTQGNQEFLQNHGQNHTVCQLTNGNVGNGANEGISGQMFFSRNGSLPSKANWNLVSTNSNFLQFWSGAMYRDDNGTTNYVRFEFNGTTFVSGRITCYGITT
jgi:hypothetical protein